MIRKPYQTSKNKKIRLSSIILCSSAANLSKFWGIPPAPGKIGIHRLAIYVAEEVASSWPFSTHYKNIAHWNYGAYLIDLRQDCNSKIVTRIILLGSIFWMRQIFENTYFSSIPKVRATCKIFKVRKTPILVAWWNTMPDGSIPGGWTYLTKSLKTFSPTKLDKKIKHFVFEKVFDYIKINLFKLLSAIWSPSLTLGTENLGIVIISGSEKS